MEGQEEQHRLTSASHDTIIEEVTKWEEDWEGKVGIGYLYSDLTPETEEYMALDYSVAYGVEDGVLGWDAEAIEGSGSSSTPEDGWYRARAFYLFSFSK